MTPAAADETHLVQILRNLISNAAKYGPREGPVEITARAGHGRLIVRVLDRGPSVADYEYALMFELYYRSHQTLRRAPGAGIGLYVCRHLVETLGGQIWGRPRPDGGSEFGFSLVPHEEAAESV